MALQLRFSGAPRPRTDAAACEDACGLNTTVQPVGSSFDYVLSGVVAFDDIDGAEFTLGAPAIFFSQSSAVRTMVARSL
jgi:hypothetical protein